MSKKNSPLLWSALFLFSFITTPVLCMEQKRTLRIFTHPGLLTRTVDEQGNAWLWAGSYDSLIVMQALLCAPQNTSQLRLVSMPKNGEITKDECENCVEWKLEDNALGTKTFKAMTSVLLCAKNK